MKAPIDLQYESNVWNQWENILFFSNCCKPPMCYGCLLGMRRIEFVRNLSLRESLTSTQKNQFHSFVFSQCHITGKKIERMLMLWVTNQRVSLRVQYCLNGTRKSAMNMILVAVRNIFI
jgi:hypothetical protein